MLSTLGFLRLVALLLVALFFLLTLADIVSLCGVKNKRYRRLRQLDIAVRIAGTWAVTCSLRGPAHLFIALCVYAIVMGANLYYSRVLIWRR